MPYGLRRWHGVALVAGRSRTQFHLNRHVTETWQVLQPRFVRARPLRLIRDQRYYRRVMPRADPPNM